MNTRLKKIGTLALVATIGFTQTGCMGSFQLLKGLYSWNETVTQNKAINNIIFWAFNILPVYSTCAFIDLVILNLPEFWTGSNPVAMGPDDLEEQEITKDGLTYTLRATQNKFELISAENKIEMSMVYTMDDATWNLQTEEGLKPLAQNLENNKVKIYYPNGSSQVFENNQENFAFLSNSVENHFALASN